MEEEIKKKSSKAPIIVLAVIMVIVIGIVIFLVCGGTELFTNNNKDDDKDVKSSSKVIDEDEEEDSKSSKSKKENKSSKKDKDSSKDEENSDKKDSKSKDKDEENSDDVENKSKEEDSSKNKEEKSDSKTSKAPSKITSKEFVIDGVTYKFGDKYSKLKENGWEIDYTYEKDDKYAIKADTVDYHSITLTNKKHDKTISACFYNDSDKDADIEDCKIYEICVYEYTNVAKYDIDFQLAGGITIGNTRDEIVDAYGTPTNESTGDYAYISYYVDDIGLYIAFNKDGEANYISYEYDEI